MRAYCTVVPAPSRISTNKHIFLSLAEAVQSSKPGVMTTPPSALEPRRTDTSQERILGCAYGVHTSCPLTRQAWTGVRTGFANPINWDTVSRALFATHTLPEASSASAN